MLQYQLVAALKSHLAGQPPHVPEAGRLAWRWFADLSRSRAHHMAGPEPIQFCEIAAYARLMRWPLQPRHVDLIVALDRTWLAHANATPTDSADRPRAPQSSSQAINPAAFDAVFG